MLIQENKQRRILAWSDSAAAGTGFGVVSKHILGALHKTGKYDINHLAINFHGDFVDKDVIPWQQQPARLLDPKDPHGIKMFARTLVKGDYDIVWICNDLYVTHQAAEIVTKVRQNCSSEGKKSPVFIYYYPVDCHVPDDNCAFLDVVDIAVCYTDHGRAETLLTVPKIEPNLLQIPHGVDTNAFKPLSQKERTLWRKKLLGVDPSTTVVINVNRNSSRKQLQYSMLAFKEFKKIVPNSIMYMHTVARDQGGDLIRAAKDIDMSLKEDIVFPIKFTPSSPIPDKILNAFYNISDIFLTTHLGEGWGLTVTEAMAAGIPVVAPDNTSMPQQLGKKSERGYMYPCNDMIWIDNSGFRPKGLLPDIVGKMLDAYEDGSKDKNPITKKARAWAKEHDWAKVTQKWIDIFDQASKKSKSKVIFGEEI